MTGMTISFFGDSLTEGVPGVSYFNILKKQLPDSELINYGVGGETVLSLYKRITRLNIDHPIDIAFLWIGTNDVYVKISWFYPILKILLNKPWVRNLADFKKYYRSLLEILTRQANRVIAVSPLFLGENLDNKWNREFEKQSQIIEELSAAFKNVEYIDLKKVFIPRLKGKEISSYLPTNAMRVALDTLTLKEVVQIDRKSTERGLHFTLDGVHLNSAGAEIIADVFYKTIKTNRTS
jgi:lysophospholipase L1-like esterase